MDCPKGNRVTGEQGAERRAHDLQGVANRELQASVPGERRLQSLTVVLTLTGCRGVPIPFPIPLPAIPIGGVLPEARTHRADDEGATGSHGGSPGGGHTAASHER